MDNLPKSYLENHFPYLPERSWADVMERNRGQAERLISSCYNIPIEELPKRIWCYELAILSATMEHLTRQQFGMDPDQDTQDFITNVIIRYKEENDWWWSICNAQEIEAGKTRFQRQDQD